MAKKTKLGGEQLDIGVVGARNRGVDSGTVAKLSIAAIVLLFGALSLQHFSNPPIAKGFSQLFFSGEVPKAVRAGEGFEVAFTVANFEGSPAMYHFLVEADSKEVGAGSVSLSNGANSTFSTRAVFSGPGKHKLNILLSKIGAEDRRPLRIYLTINVV